MTHKLMQILRTKYSFISQVQFSDISGYPPPEGNERIYFSYCHKNYMNYKNELITTEQIKNIATLVFDDVGWNFYEKKGLMQNAIIFYINEKISKKRFEYQSRYDGHDIEFGKLDVQLYITISTGNRGGVKLHQRQRKKYESFIEEVVKETIRNTEKTEK